MLVLVSLPERALAPLQLPLAGGIGQLVAAQNKVLDPPGTICVGLAVKERVEGWVVVVPAMTLKLHI